MKKTLLFTVTCLLTHLLYAQITITTNDLPSLGTSFRMLEDKNEHGFTITSGSATTQSWDYSHSFVYHDTLNENYVLPVKSPYHDSFPDADMAIAQDVESGFLFFKKTSIGLYLDGMHFTEPDQTFFLLNFKPNLLLLPVPFAYGASKNDTTGFEVLFKDGGQPVKVQVKSSSTYEADAFGSLKTPVAQYDHTLRIKTSTLYHTKVYVYFNNAYNLVDEYDSSSIDYNWYVNGPHSRVLSANADVSKQIVKASYLFEPHAGIMENQEVSSLELFPNPTESSVYLKTGESESGSYNLSVYSAEGKLITSKNAEKMRGEDLVLNVADLSPGFYFVQVQAIGGVYLKVAKFRVGK